MMRVLVACEFSGRVRESFIALGHDAWSCDLLPTEIPGNHIVGNVLEVINQGWDLMVAHPPCTYLAQSGVNWLYVGGKKGNPRNVTRWYEMEAAAIFFRALWDAPIPKIAIENPVMHGYGREIIGVKYGQVIQPYQFGEHDSKKTCLWLRGLPPLMATLITSGRSQVWHDNTPGGKSNRGKNRSYTYWGIARAMAIQWGGNVKQTEAA